jgi:hypothetical protein
MPSILNDVVEVITIVATFPQLVIQSYPQLRVIVSQTAVTANRGCYSLRARLASPNHSIGYQQKALFEGCRPIALL